MPETTILTPSPETVERPCADQVALERAEPQAEPEAAHPVAVEETRAKETVTRAMRWYELEPAPEVEESVESKTEVKRESKQARWYEGYRPGYFC